jgi:hypothetical protein
MAVVAPSTDGSSVADWWRYPGTFSSYARTGALWQAMMFTRTPEFRRRLFLDEHNVCDAL